MLLPLLLNLQATPASPTNSSLKVRIHNAILGLLRSGPYYAVSYDPDSRDASPIDTNSATQVSPASCQTNELAAAFELDRNYGRSRRFDRREWSWLGIVKFNREVTATIMEEALTLAPVILPRTEVFRQATIELVRSVYTHPTKQGSHGGSLLEFTFNVRLSRR